LYERLAGRKLREGVIFAGWYIAVYPNTIRNDEMRKLVEEIREQLGSEIEDRTLLAPFIDYPVPGTD